MKSIKLAKSSQAEQHERKRKFGAFQLAETKKIRELKAFQLAEAKELREVETRILAEKQNLYDAIAELSQFMGISIRNMGQPGLKRGDKPSSPVLYLNPADVSQQWEGRGAKPKWLREWLAAGKSLDQVCF